MKRLVSKLAVIAAAALVLAPAAGAKEKDVSAELVGSSNWAEEGSLTAFEASGTFTGTGTLRRGTYVGSVVVEPDVVFPGGPETYCGFFGCQVVSGTFTFAVPGGTLVAAIDPTLSHTGFPFFGRTVGLRTHLTLAVTSAAGRFKHAVGSTLWMDYTTSTTATCFDEQGDPVLCPIFDLGSLRGAL